MATKTVKEEIIEDITYDSSKQSIARRMIYDYKNTKVRLSLLSDAYRSQCYARAEVLDGYDWKPLYNIPSAKMKTPVELRYYPEFQPVHADFSKASRYFETDVVALKGMVKKLI